MNNEPKGLEPWQEQETEAAAFVALQRVASARQQVAAAKPRLPTSLGVARCAHAYAVDLILGAA